jgi:hypothetical protein
MVTDSLMFDRDYVSFVMAPELVMDFIKNDRLWERGEIVDLLNERNRLLDLIRNETKELDFLPRNRLVLIFQKNIVKNKTIKKYERWFEFAERTRNANNKEEDFREYKGDEIFSEMMIRLKKDNLTEDDFLYINKETEIWDEVELLEKNMYEGGRKDGHKAGIIEGKIEGKKEGMIEGKKEGKKEMAKMLKESGIDTDIIAKTSGLSKEEIEKL